MAYYLAGGTGNLMKEFEAKSGMNEEGSIKSDASDPPQRMTRRKALAFSIRVPLFLYLLLVIGLGDTLFPFKGIPPGREHRAAIAIRDNESPAFKWWTRLFTEPHLYKYYDSYWYFTQMHKGDCEEEFKAALETALNQYQNVDLFLLAHTNKYIEWVAPLPQELRDRIRFVYNTGCYNQKQGPEWLALGADSYIGHPGRSQSPYFYFFLLRHWTRGEALNDILEIGNYRAFTKFRQLEFVTNNRVNAQKVMIESVASCVGDCQLRIGDKN